MPIRKKGERDMPAISTASLPDIIFILLFFFMVATVMRETDMLVNIKPAKATELKKLEKKSLVSYIYVGPPTEKYQEKYGTAPKIQLNDAFAEKEDIIQFIEDERSKVNEKLIPQMTTSLRVDRDVKMGIVTDIKQKLRRASALKVNYSAVPRSEALD
jgi:biopolymer transport protein ExbD